MSKQSLRMLTPAAGNELAGGWRGGFVDSLIKGSIEALRKPMLRFSNETYICAACT
jgi:hypothetical protein